MAVEFVLWRETKSVQHIHLMARSYWLAPKNQYRWFIFPLPLFLSLALGFSSEPRICWCFAFKKELQRTTWFQLWKWKAIASVWCFSTLVYRHIKHKEGKRRKEGGGGGAVKGFATTTSIQTIILVACGCCECFSAEFPPIKESDWLKHTFKHFFASLFIFAQEHALELKEIHIKRQINQFLFQKHPLL